MGEWRQPSHLGDLPRVRWAACWRRWRQLSPASCCCRPRWILRPVAFLPSLSLSLYLVAVARLLLVNERDLHALVDAALIFGLHHAYLADLARIGDVCAAIGLQIHALDLHNANGLYRGRQQVDLGADEIRN